MSALDSMPIKVLAERFDSAEAIERSWAERCEREGLHPFVLVALEQSPSGTGFVVLFGFGPEPYEPDSDHLLKAAKRIAWAILDLADDEIASEKEKTI